MRLTASLKRRDDVVGERSWHGSPDVRPRIVTDPTIPPPDLPWQFGLLPIAGDNVRRFQAALKSRTQDPRIRVNGLFDAYFDEIARQLLPPDPTLPPGAPPVPPGRVTAGIWGAVMQPPHGSAEAWGIATPTETDLHDSTPTLTEGTLLPASVNLRALPCKVEVVVHRRGLTDISGGDVLVTLLRWIDPASPQTANPASSLTWFGGPVPWGPAVDEVLNSNTGTTSQTFGDGWSFVGTTDETRRKPLVGQHLDNTHSGVASFDLNLTGLAGQVVLLVAVIRADGDSSIQSLPIKDLALTNPHVAVRSIRVTV
jgi:hypothetical protein